MPDICPALSKSLAMKSGMPVPQIAPCIIFFTWLTEHSSQSEQKISLCCHPEVLKRNIRAGRVSLPEAPAPVGKSHACCWEVCAVSAVITTSMCLGAHQVWPADPDNQSAHAMTLERSRGLVA